jgi:two-component system OmpR family response regulator
MLRANGFTAESVRTGREALEFIANAPTPDLIYMDIALPDTNGVDLTHRLRAAGYTGSVVAQSGAKGLLDSSKLDAAHFDEFHQKPLRLNELIDIAQRFVPERSRP